MSLLCIQNGVPSIEVILFPETGNSVFANFVFVKGVGTIQAGNVQVSLSLLASFFFTWWSLSAGCQACSPLFHWGQKSELLLLGALHLSCFSFSWHTNSLKGVVPPSGLGWGISWHAKFLASTSLKVACCYCFCSRNSWDRNVGSLSTQFTLLLYLGDASFQATV